jgi:hypothetical protein
LGAIFGTLSNLIILEDTWLSLKLLNGTAPNRKP